MDLVGVFGRSHPLWVHLPIGIILVGLLLYWRSWFGMQADRRLLTFIFGAGAVTAILSCISGYTLSLSGAEDDAVVTHRNSALFLALLAIIFWWMFRSGTDRKIVSGFSVVLAIMLSLTGHQGGTLTHGEGFLWNDGSESKSPRKALANVDEAAVYPDIIDPILQDKCVSCHGPRKQKGKLRLDDLTAILKGGKNGAAVVAGNTDKSKMLYRIMLPPDDEDHMPPKDKGQLTRAEVSLIKWWIAKGASPGLKVKELQPDAGIRAALTALSSTRSDETAEDLDAILPEVGKADDAAVEQLRKAGAVVTPVAQGSNLLYVNLINCSNINDTLLTSLRKIAGQLYWLKAEGPGVNDKLVATLPEYKQLKKLSLANAKITEASRKVLGSMKNLEKINLYGTALDSSGPKQ